MQGHVLIEVQGGIVQETHGPDDVTISVFDWDNWQDADPEDRDEMLSDLPDAVRSIIEAQMVEGE